jgi:hypothetical protein
MAGYTRLSVTCRSSLPLARILLSKFVDKHSGGIWYFVMKLRFPNCRAHSEFRAVLIVAAVLALGMLTKLDSSIQLFHLSH